MSEKEKHNVIGKKVKMIDAYKQFLDNKTNISPCGSVAPYNWYELPDQLPIQWMAYTQMLSEHSRELANSINELLRYITSLAAWKGVIDSKDGDVKYEIIIEFVSPIATLAINLPYVIRSRFIYSVAHLCHQANQTKQKEWADDLPIDHEIYFNAADNYCLLWKQYTKLKITLEKISNKKFQSDTYDFRNKYNHRYSPRIELGLTGLVTRNVKNDGRANYAFGYTDPLKIDQLLPALTEQHANCLRAFEKYRKLVNEHISAIERA